MGGDLGRVEREDDCGLLDGDVHFLAVNFFVLARDVNGQVKVVALRKGARCKDRELLGSSFTLVEGQRRDHRRDRPVSGNHALKQLNGERILPVPVVGDVHAELAFNQR